MRTRNERCEPRPKSSSRSRPASGQSSPAKAFSTARSSGFQAGVVSSRNAPERSEAPSASSARAAGLAVRTRPRRSTTATPSSISSMTRRFRSACCRAYSRLPRAARSSRARRDAISLASSVTTNRPQPSSPAWLMRSAPSCSFSTAQPDIDSSTRLGKAAQPSARSRGCSAPAISAGMKNSAP